MAIIKSINRVS